MLTVIRAATCLSTGNGAWSNSATWSCGSVPTCGDSIVIQAGHTVSIVAEDYTGCSGSMYLMIKGTLKFTATGKLEFACGGKVYVYSTGQIISAGGTGNSNAVMTCGSTWWNAAAGTYNGPGCMPATIPGCNAFLPVELAFFDASVCNGTNICFRWTTHIEFDNDHFQIERSSDGIEFSELTRVAAAPAERSRLVNEYAAEDSRPLKGVNYYRLRQVNRDGSSKIYETVALHPVGEQLGVSLFPNPSSGDLFIRIQGSRSQSTGTFFISNNIGEALNENVFSVNEGETVFSYPSHLSPGLYLLRLTVSGQDHHFKVLVND
jgi:hypothetical protein